MQSEINLLPIFLLPALIGLVTAMSIGAVFALLYFTVFRSLIKTWHQERARNQPAQHPIQQHGKPIPDKEALIALIRKEVRDELIRKGIS